MLNDEWVEFDSQEFVVLMPAKPIQKVDESNGKEECKMEDYVFVTLPADYDGPFFEIIATTQVKKDQDLSLIAHELENGGQLPVIKASRWNEKEEFEVIRQCGVGMIKCTNQVLMKPDNLMKGYSGSPFISITKGHPQVFGMLRSFDLYNKIPLKAHAIKSQDILEAYVALKSN